MKKPEKPSVRQHQLKLLLVTLFVWVLLSCASVPKPSSFYKNPPDEFSALDGGGTSYFYIDVKKSAPILDNLETELIPRGGRTGQIRDMTDKVAAVTFREGSGRKYMAIAYGKFPKFRASLSLAFSSEWKKKKSPTGNSYWYSSKQSLSVFLNKDRAYVSDGDPFVIPPGFSAPPLLGELSEGAVLAGMTVDAKETVSRFLDDMGLAIKFPGEVILFGLYEEKESPENEISYRGLFYIETPSVREARAFQSVFALARMLLLGGGMTAVDDEYASALTALFTNSPELEDSTIILRTGPLSGQGIALLFNLFTVY